MNNCFLMDLETLEEFYRRCEVAKANTEIERQKILLDLFYEKKAKYLGATDMNAPELATEFIKRGMNAKSYGYKKPKNS